MRNHLYKRALYKFYMLDRGYYRWRAKNLVHKAMRLLENKQTRTLPFIVRTAFQWKINPGEELGFYGRFIKGRQKGVRETPQCNAGISSGRVRGVTLSDQEAAEARRDPQGGSEGSNGRGRGRDRGGELYRQDHTDIAEQIEHLIDPRVNGHGMDNEAHEGDRYHADQNFQERRIIPDPIRTPVYAYTCTVCCLGYTHAPDVPCPNCQEKEALKGHPGLQPMTGEY